MENTPVIDVNTATRNELLAAAKKLGLDAPNTMSKEALKDLIAMQTGQKVAAEGAGTPERGAQVEKNLAEQRKQKRIRIRIHENKDHPIRIPVNVNGVRYTIKPGVWVDVPAAVVEVLKNAKASYIVQMRDERGHDVNVVREGLQFPFEIASSDAVQMA